MIFSSKNPDDSTIVDLLASSLRRDIAFGTLLPDQRLKIAELRGRYGGSNHSMRETLRILSTEGLVEATAQRGFRVTSATEDDLRDIALVRVEIEKVALSRAIARGDVAWEGRVMAAHHGLQKAEAAVAAAPDDLTALKWDEACRAFARALLEACDSPPAGYARQVLRPESPLSAGAVARRKARLERPQGQAEGAARGCAEQEPDRGTAAVTRRYRGRAQRTELIKTGRKS